MKKKVRILALLLVIILALPMVSCSSSKAPELCDIKERLVYLIEESKELNVLFFGNGLPVYRRDEALSDRKMVYFNDTLTSYERVMENSDYAKRSR